VSKVQLSILVLVGVLGLVYPSSSIAFQVTPTGKKLKGYQYVNVNNAASYLTRSVKEILTKTDSKHYYCPPKFALQYM